MSKAMRQMPESSGRVGVARGEAGRDPASDEASGPPREHPDTGSARPKAGAGPLLEAALTRENLHRAWKRVKANKGAAGVDGLDIEQRPPSCCAHGGAASAKRCWQANTGLCRYEG